MVLLGNRCGGSGGGLLSMLVMRSLLMHPRRVTLRGVLLVVSI